MEIRKVANGVKFVYTGRSITENTRQIKNIVVKKDFQQNDVLLIWLTCHSPLRIAYSSVTYPLSADAEALKDIILLWNNDDVQQQTFTATAGQTSFVTSFALQSNVSVFIIGILQSPTSYTYTVGSNIVTWVGTPLTGGEEVIITTN